VGRMGVCDHLESGGQAHGRGTMSSVVRWLAFVLVGDVYWWMWMGGGSQ